MNQAPGEDKTSFPLWLMVAIVGFSLALFGLAYVQTRSVVWSCGAVIIEFLFAAVLFASGVIPGGNEE